MKRFLSILLVAVLIASILPVGVLAANGSATIYVNENESKTVKAGQEVTLTVRIAGKFAGYKLYMKADDGLTITAINGGKGHTINMGKNNVVVWASENNYDGSNHTFTVKVKVADNAKPGNYKVYTQVKSASMNIPIEEDIEDGYVDGLVDVDMKNGSATLTIVCEHDYVGEITTEPTCDKAGVKTFTCSVCGDSYTKQIPAKGHNYQEKVTTAPTCGAEGVKTFTCSNCGHSYTKVIPATGNHDYQEKVTTAPTCDKDGEKTFTCSVCGDSRTEVIPALGHDNEETIIKQPTCTEDGEKATKCKRCGHKEDSVVIPALGHDWNEGEITKQPTCTEAGEKLFTCDRCGETKTESIDALGHDYEWVEKTPATCTEAGVEEEVCKVCGHKSGNTRKVNALGHDYEWTIVENATCIKDGLKKGVCKRCGDVTEEKIPAGDGHHVWGEDTVTKEPTCTEDGELTHKCTICGATETVVVPALGHGAEKWETNETHHWHVCALCGVKCDEAEHTFGEWEVTKDATFTEKGEKTRKCSVCEYAQTEETPVKDQPIDPEDPPKTGDPTGILMIGGLSILLLLLAVALYCIKRKASAK